MDTSLFWDLLDRSRAAASEEDGQRWFDALKTELLALEPDQMLAFYRLFDERVAAAYKTDLWGAGYLINGGCSDDGFHYFRCWLVGQGQAVYERALQNPDSLADILSGESPCEESLDVAPARAWEEKTGRTTEEFYQELGETGGSQPEEEEDWDFDDEEEMRRRFPRLSQIYLEDSD